MYHDLDDDEEHDHDHDHDHDHTAYKERVLSNPLEENGLWLMDNIQLHSVGIDVGSAGTQVMFSRLTLRRMGEDLSSRFVVVEREALYLSPISFTPYIDGERIDGVKLGQIIQQAYAEAGLTPAEIDAGAVILTGEAIRRHNAEAIATALAEQGGEFVCVAAGHNMESVLAAYGSGAALCSHERACRVLNIDIGGGTTKLAVVEHGKVVDTAALYLGGRLLVVGPDGCITRLEPGACYVASQLGLELAVGASISSEQLEAMADWMAGALLAAVTGQVLAPEIEQLYLTPRLKSVGSPAGVMFSGGVAEYVYAREERDFGDLGRLLGMALRRRLASGALPWQLFPAGECIRATVVGASEHTVQVSGNTLLLSNPGLLPRRNIQVLNPGCDLTGPIDAGAVAGQIREHFATFDLQEGQTEVALAFRWGGEPSYQRVHALSQGIVQALPVTVAQRRPLYLIFDGDIASTVGTLLKAELGVQGDVIVIDSVRLEDFDFIDLGRRLEPSGIVPVTIKSLLFHLTRSEGGQSGGVRVETNAR